MVFTTAVGNIGPVVMAADDDTFVEVTVPNGDFESGETAWTFTGDIQDLDYYWRLFQSPAMTNNPTTMYEVCSKKNTSVTKTYKCSQTVTGLVPGTYKASIDATGGNDPGTHTTTLTAGGKTVAVTPNKWNEWVTYTTDTFEVGEDGKCEISIDSTVTGQYLDMDNVKLYRKSEAGPKVVDKVSDITKEVTVGSTFTAPKQATVLYTDGTNALFDVTWNSNELAKVDTATAGKTFTVNGKVTVEEQEYDAVLTVEILDASGLVQEIPEDALGSVDFDANWQFYLATRTPEVADGGFAAAGVKDAGDYTTDEIVDPSFNDLGWRTVDVPHDFSIEGEKVKSSSDAQAYLEGILVVEEAFDGWGAAKATYDFGNFFFQEVPSDWAGLKPNGYTQLPTPGVNYDGAKLTWSDWVVQEMVNRDKNEPSVIAWSIGNEVRGVGSK